MKTIIKSGLIAIALLVGISVSAQDKPLTFGVKAGMNLSNVGGDADGTDAKIGFNAGVTMDYGFTPDIYLLTGLELTTKGYKADDDFSSNLMYLQLPVHVGYKLAVTDATKIVFHAGPYIAYGIGGKTKFNEDGEKYKYDSFDAFKKFDFGLGLGVGAEFGKLGVGLGYDFGLLNIMDSEIAELEDITVRNMNAYLTVGYKF